MNKQTLVYDHFNNKRDGRISYRDGNSKNLKVSNMFVRVNFTDKVSNAKYRRLKVKDKKIKLKHLTFAVLDLYDKSYTSKRIAMKLKCSVIMVYDIKNKESIKQLIESGVSEKNLSATLGLCQNTINRLLKQIKNEKNM